MLAVIRPTRPFPTGGFFVSVASFCFVFFRDILSFLFCSGRLQCQPVISVSPAKADRTSREGHHPAAQSAARKLGTPLRASGPVFRQKFTDKGWHEWIPARRGNNGTGHGRMNRRNGTPRRCP